MLLVVKLFTTKTLKIKFMSDIEQNHSGSGDNISGDKYSVETLKILNNSTYKPNISNFNSYGDKISERDLKIFSLNVHHDKIKQFKNLLDQIQFKCELGEYFSAKESVVEATAIWHNYHKLMLYNALCTFATSDISELVFRDNQTDKIKKLVIESKKIPKDELYNLITKKIAENFYELIRSNVNKLNTESKDDEKKMIYYRYAMACHINRLEFCFELSPQVKYLEKCVEYLSGNKKFAWLTLDKYDNPVDLNRDFFKEGIMDKRNSLINKIRSIDPNYQIPDLWFGNYFEKPEKKDNYVKTLKSYRYFYRSLILLGLPLTGILFLIYMTFDSKTFIEFLIVFIPTTIFIFPFGEFRLSLVHRITRFLSKFITK